MPSDRRPGFGRRGGSDQGMQQPLFQRHTLRGPQNAVVPNHGKQRRHAHSGRHAATYLRSLLPDPETWTTRTARIGHRTHAGHVAHTTAQRPPLSRRTSRGHDFRRANPDEHPHGHPTHRGAIRRGRSGGRGRRTRCRRTVGFAGDRTDRRGQRGTADVPDHAVEQTIPGGDGRQRH